MALLACKGHASNNATATFCNDHVCPTTVRNRTLKLGTSVLSVFAGFSSDCEQLLVDSQWDCSYDIRCSVHVLSGDATKHFSSEKKYQCLRITATYVFGDGRDDLSHEVWPDVARCTAGTGSACFDIMKKQCRIVNCHVFDKGDYEPCWYQ